MNNNGSREPRHGFWKLAAVTLPLLCALGCSSAESGHAPGVAGGQTLTPGITNYPLAYVKQPVPPDAAAKATSTPPDIDVRDLITSISGGDLYVRSQASAGGTEINVTKTITGGKGAVRDLDVSPDGTKLVFSLRLPLDPAKKNTDPTQPNWKIYQYDAATAAVTQLTKDDVTSGHDVGPHYLPDGRIVFSSTRQLATQSILLDEGRPQYQAVIASNGIDKQPIFLLHVMNGDGTGMHQISFNTDHDFAPSVLASGYIVFSRWEITNGADQMSLYTSRPDGTDLQLYYGANSHATGANLAGTNTNVIQFLNARQRADGKLIAIDRPFVGTQLGGDALLIDAANYVECTQPAQPLPLSTPPTLLAQGPVPPCASGTSGLGQASATGLGVTTDAGQPSPGGRFASAYPLYDGTNRMLVSWAPCLVSNTDGTTAVCTAANTAAAGAKQAPPQYTLWIYDFSAGTLSPVLSAEAGTEIVEPVILQARTPAPTILPDAAPSTAAGETMANDGVGLLDIGSVYDFDAIDTVSIAAVSDPAQAAYYQRPARFIRIEKAVEIPSEKVRKISDSVFGPAGVGMREILGYAPIQPDGSVQIQVPANVPFTIEVLDENARRILSAAQHTSWLQLRPGETKSCIGCHSTANLPSHGRSGLTAPVAGASAGGFPNTNPSLTAAQGETMAQTLARYTCAQGSTLPCSQLLTTDVLYTLASGGLEWTTGATIPAGFVDAPIAYTYSGTAGLSETPPTNANCSPSWTAQCRITIHYADAAAATPLYLQTVWNLSSRTATVNGVANAPAVCVSCHTGLNTAPNAKSPFQVPAGQLDLTAGATNNDPTDPDQNLVTSYQELLFPHDEQFLNIATVQTLPGPVVLQNPMTPGSANASTSFFRMFDGTFHDTVLDHTGFLTPAELRLISEWLDIGGQFYNDPFVAPTN